MPPGAEGCPVLESSPLDGEHRPPRKVFAMSDLAISNPRGWLRAPGYDLTLIVGVAALALASGWVVVRQPELFPLVLFLDLWLLGYHHVVSTFTRLAFDQASFRQHRFLVLGLPFLVLGGVLLGAWALGGWILSTTYLYWQWFHYTRQSYGIERAYRRRAGDAVPGSPRITRWLLYLVPLWGILYRTHQAPDTFLGVELKTPPMPLPVVTVIGGAALALFAWWLAQWIVDLARGRGLKAHSLYLASHLVIFIVGYVVIADLDHGWLVVNVWHNAQYILFVWHFNANRFRAGRDPQHRFLSYLSQRRNWPWYMATCLAISSVAYLGIERTLGLFAAQSTLPLFLITYQTINFHHYIVDGLIWKMRKKPLQKTLGLEAKQG